jgi:hypothetical protein
VGVVRLAQVWQAGARDHERPARVDLLHEVEALHLEVPHRRQVDGAGVVHHQVDAAEALHRLGHRGVHGVGVADVSDDRERLAAGRLDLLGGGVDRARELRVRLGGLRHERDLHSVAGGPGGDRESDSPASA